MPLISERARTQPARLVKSVDEYDFAVDHHYMKTESGLNFDVLLETGYALALLVLWWVDEHGTDSYLQAWEDGQMRTIQEGDHPLMEYAHHQCHHARLGILCFTSQYHFL